MSKSFKVFLNVLGLLIGLTVVYFLFFNSTYLKMYPYKYTDISIKEVALKEAKTNLNSTIKEIEEKKKLVEGLQQEKELKEKEYDKVMIEPDKFSLPEGIDTASFLIFIEEQALLNNVYIKELSTPNSKPTEIIPDDSETVGLEVDDVTESVNSIPEETLETNDDTPVNPDTININPDEEMLLNNPGIDMVPANNLNRKDVTVEIIGKYVNIEGFLKSINDNIGQFNYIKTIELSRGKKEAFEFDDLEDFSSNTSNIDTEDIALDISKMGSIQERNVKGKIIIQINYK